MLEFRKYGPAPAEEKDPPMCVVTYPETCGESAVGEVWSLPFCEAHGREAVAAARLEAYEDAGRELDALMGGLEGEHAVKNPLVYEALKGARIPGPHPDALALAPLIRAACPLDAAPGDPDTLAHGYDEACDTPYDWWSEAREMVVGWMREAYEAGQSSLVEALEPIRELATVQQELALDDMERRYVAPRRAAREEQRRRDAERVAVREPAAGILYDVNGVLGGVLERLEELPAEGSFDREAVRKARGFIAEAGGIVATEERRVFVAEEARRREDRERPAG